MAWLGDTGDTGALLAAGLAHLWLVTIHPFDDDNGRIARAIADMVLARSDRSDQRFYSMSGHNRAEGNDYYDQLARTQKDGIDITTRQIWFLECLQRVTAAAYGTLSAVLNKARFWERVAK